MGKPTLVDPGHVKMHAGEGHPNYGPIPIYAYQHGRAHQGIPANFREENDILPHVKDYFDKNGHNLGVGAVLGMFTSPPYRIPSPI